MQHLFEQVVDDTIIVKRLFFAICCVIWMKLYQKLLFFIPCLDRHESWLLIFWGQWRHFISVVGHKMYVCIYKFVFILFIHACFVFWNKNSAKYDKWSFELWINRDKSTNICIHRILGHKTSVEEEEKRNHKVFHTK